MKIEVHESALDSIKAMGQRDKERIEELENALQQIAVKLVTQIDCAPAIAGILLAARVYPSSGVIIQKAE